jgi:hypothetical protein
LDPESSVFLTVFRNQAGYVFAYDNVVYFSCLSTQGTGTFVFRGVVLFNDTDLEVKTMRVG